MSLGSAVLPLDRCKCTAETDHGGQDDASTVAVAPVSGDISVMRLHSVFTIDSGFKRQLMVPDIVKKKTQTKNCSDWLVRELRSSN